MPDLTFVDLFAGAGGLSTGLFSAGFQHKLAVERSAFAAETYFRNFVDDSEDGWREHQSAPLPSQLSRGLVVDTSAALLDQPRLLRRLRGQVDLLAGGPPCQGFSLAGLRDPADRRNRLPFEFLEFVHTLRPRAVLIENVLGIGLSFSRSPGVEPALIQLARAVRDLGYWTEVLYVNARHFGVAQNRPRIMIVGLDRRLARRWLGGTSARNGTIEWHSDRPTPAALFGPRVSETEVPARAVLGDLDDSGYALGLDEYPDQLLPARALRCGSSVRAPLPASGSLANHALRRHSPGTSERFRLIADLHRRGIKGNLFEHATEFWSEAEAVPELERALMNNNRQLSAFDGTEGSQDSQPIGQLARRIYALRSRKHSQRLIDPDRPAPTVLTLPDDLVHYAAARVPTVRELARLQSFPDSFVFYGNATTGGGRRALDVPQYSQVGNAVPPLLAKAIGTRLRELLDDG